MAGLVQLKPADRPGSDVTAETSETTARSRAVDVKQSDQSIENGLESVSGGHGHLNMPASAEESKDCGCSVPPTTVNGKASRQKGDASLPSKDMLAACANLPLFGEDGKERSFKSIIEGDGRKSRHMIIFIRHFFCGMCQAYVSALSEGFGPADLPENATITIIGCGHHDLIPNYAQATRCAYPLYTDPTGRIYNALHMSSTLELGPKAPDYNKQGILTTSMKSVMQVFSWKGGLQINKAGSWSQVGGEFLFERTKGQDTGMGEWGVTFCHRMRNTRDHMEVDQMKRLLHDAGSD